MSTKRLTLALLALLAALALVACGNGSASSSSQASRCVPASPAQITHIEAGVNGVQSTNHVKTGWAVKSNEFENVWMVAALIEGPGLEEGEAIGVWAIGGTPNNPNLTLAVNSFAREFSDYPDASKTKAQITLYTDGVQEAIQCVKQHLPKK